MENYRWVRKIGRGSYGEIWLVRNQRDKKHYVLKQINLQNASERELRSAQLEAQLLATLRHPNIVSYRDSFETGDGFLYIAMGYCEGGDLHSRIRNQRGVLFEESQVVEWFIQICMALQYLHDRNILHRDLKTQNIFLTKSKMVKVGDLGIAKVLDGNTAMATTLIGTPYYMSPELFSNRPYNFKSDIWALGCCAYELITLKHAFNARDIRSLVHRIVTGKFPAMPGSYSTQLQDLIRVMLSHSPEKRPSVTHILRHPYIRKSIAVCLEGTRLMNKKTPDIAISSPASESLLNQLENSTNVIHLLAQGNRVNLENKDKDVRLVSNRRSGTDRLTDNKQACLCPVQERAESSSKDKADQRLSPKQYIVQHEPVSSRKPPDNNLIILEELPHKNSDNSSESYAIKSVEDHQSRDCATQHPLTTCRSIKKDEIVSEIVEKIVIAHQSDVQNLAETGTSSTSSSESLRLPADLPCVHQKCLASTGTKTPVLTDESTTVATRPSPRPSVLAEIVSNYSRPMLPNNGARQRRRQKQIEALNGNVKVQRPSSPSPYNKQIAVNRVPPAEAEHVKSNNAFRMDIEPHTSKSNYLPESSPNKSSRSRNFLSHLEDEVFIVGSSPPTRHIQRLKQEWQVSARN